MEEKESSKLFGIEVPAEERTPLVERLFRVIEQQRAEIEQMRAEIARLKGLPPRPKIRPSTLNEPHPDPSHKKKRRGKRPGSAKRRKTGGLIIHETIPVPLEGLPEGTRQNGYVLYQHHQNQVTQPLIHEELLDLGMDISTGQIDRLLTEGHDPFHEEKDALLHMKEQKLSKTLLARLAAATRRGDRIVWGDKAWERQLRAWGIHAEDPRRIVTEGALVGTLIHYEMYLDQPLAQRRCRTIPDPGLSARPLLAARRTVAPQVAPVQPAGTGVAGSRPRRRVEILPTPARLPGIAHAPAEGRAPA